MRKKDLTGRKFGRLSVLNNTNQRQSGHIFWHCVCKCGREIDIRQDSLLNGTTKSCGCWRAELAGKNIRKIGPENPNYKHGDGCTQPRLYRIWNNMKRRCHHNAPPNIYKYYAGRGISVCSEWINNYSYFKIWALSQGYKDDLTIDRINNDGNYCPENCRWISRAENLRAAVIVRETSRKLAKWESQKAGVQE